MDDIIVYDKVSWHHPEGQNCPNLEAAKVHFRFIMKWLKENSLLSEEGEEILKFGICANFSITSPMLNGKGNNILEKHYSNWLKTVDYPKNISLNILDDALLE